MKYEYIGDKIKITIKGELRVLTQGDIIECDESEIQNNPKFVKIENNKTNKKGGK